ncbi:MAG: ATP-binding cassette domain-containing protein [Flavobacteriales bacterium]|jgi:phospholipid/cholesterol/gamma-HCH transport system ATP-binding protein|nr:ATP-binding cassette domain-containing protein [Flavobacteriales bacterium]MBQ5814575.1 ATP-binding cassette domain-containing protein [Flavobacteriales bacterium]
MLQAINICKSFDGKEVLKDISATFDAGKTNLIIGQSGAGKTVFLKSLTGLITPDAGDILYGGMSYNAMSEDEKNNLRHEIGMVFQGGALFDSMDVEENVMFPLMMFSAMSRSEMRDRVDWALRRVNLPDVQRKTPAELSGGMKKRVAIARGIIMNPKYLFCDEPNSGLDPKTSIVIDQLISEITHEYGMTTIINTHDMNSVMEIGEKIIFLKGGRKAWEGTSAEILEAQNTDIVDFVYSSPILKALKESKLRK